MDMEQKSKVGRVVTEVTSRFRKGVSSYRVHAQKMLSMGTKGKVILAVEGIVIIFLISMILIPGRVDLDSSYDIIKVDKFRNNTSETVYVYIKDDFRTENKTKKVVNHLRKKGYLNGVGFDIDEKTMRTLSSMYEVDSHAIASWSEQSDKIVYGAPVDIESTYEIIVINQYKNEKKPTVFFGVKEGYGYVDQSTVRRIAEHLQSKGHENGQGYDVCAPSFFKTATEEQQNAHLVVRWGEKNNKIELPFEYWGDMVDSKDEKATFSPIDFDKLEKLNMEGGASHYIQMVKVNYEGQLHDINNLRLKFVYEGQNDKAAECVEVLKKCYKSALKDLDKARDLAMKKKDFRDDENTIKKVYDDSVSGLQTTYYGFDL